MDIVHSRAVLWLLVKPPDAASCLQLFLSLIMHYVCAYHLFMGGSNDNYNSYKINLDFWLPVLQKGWKEGGGTIHLNKV